MNSAVVILGDVSRAAPLPASLRGTPFRVRDGSAAGVSASRLRSLSLDRSWWGLRSDTTLDTVASRCAAVALRMPPLAFFSHVTAALLHGIPMPWQLQRDQHLHVAVPAPARAPHASGIRGHQLRLAEADVVLRGGLRVTSPERTWCDLATLLSLPDLVAAGDYLIHHRRPITSRARLAAAVRRRRTGRGVHKLTEALHLLDARSESPQESRLRVILVRGGAPDIEVNEVVTDLFGEFVARTDIRIKAWRLLIEYQGDYHRTTKGQWRADMTRRSKLEVGAERWRVMELNADDLEDPDELMDRIRRRVAQD